MRISLVKKAVVWDTVLTINDDMSPSPAHTKGSSKDRHMKLDEPSGLDNECTFNCATV